MAGSATPPYGSPSVALPFRFCRPIVSVRLTSGSAPCLFHLVNCKLSARANPYPCTSDNQPRLRAVFLCALSTFSLVLLRATLCIARLRAAFAWNSDDIAMNQSAAPAAFLRSRLTPLVHFAAACCLALALAPPAKADATNPPFFTAAFTNTGSAGTSANQINYGPNLLFTNQVQTNGPAEVTNGTTLYVTFISNSLGQTNLSANTTGFAFGGGGTTNASNLPGIVNPPITANPSNLYYPNGGISSNNFVWMGLNLTPGTNTTAVTNYLQILAINGNNNSTTNWAVTNLALTVAPPPPGPPALQVRFYNSSTNAASNVYILPTSTDALGSFGNGFWWSNSSGSNNLTNFVATNGGFATVRLSDIEVSGTNAQSQPYYAIYMTNFPNAAWYLSYGGGSLTNGTAPPTPQTNGVWSGYEWASFEVTLAGNPADKCDLTYINQFSIPMTVRALTNDHASSVAQIYPSNSLAFYQICGFTNWTSASAVAARLTNLATQFSVNFSNAALTNAGGKVVMYAGPSAAGMGSLKGPHGTQAYLLFSNYFTAVRTNTARTNKIKDSIGLAGATNAGLGTNPVFLFYYDFDLVVTASNTLLLTNGTINVANQPGSTGTNLTPTNYTDLWMEIGADAGPSDSWASSAVYLAPTPAGYVKDYGTTNAALQTYTTNATNTNLVGTLVFKSSTNAWMQIGSNTGTIRGTNGAAVTNPTVYDLYSQQFGTAVMGRILGDMAAGFALGFINSGTTNPAMGVAYGDSPSGSWWGGNEYPQADTVNSVAYSDVNTNYSAWGGAIYSATKVTYGHPIYDRMQFYGGGNATNPLQIQPASATNNQVSGVGGAVPLPVWVVEVEFFNGLSSVGDTPTPPPSNVLTYSNWLTNYSSLTGANTNTTADPDGDGFINNEEYAFGGNPTNPTPNLINISGSTISYIGLTNADTNYAVQNTTNLVTGPWTNYATTVTNATDQLNIPLPAYYERKAFTVPVTSGTNNFYRIIFSNQ